MRHILYPYFDVACLSFDEGVQKPDNEIFYRCMRRLNVSAEECIYVGDGGSYELETARALGMHAVQAAWYLKENTKQPTTFMPEFEPKKRPLEILKMV
ncbi:MAG: HAD-IA family hydrolase [Eubacteriales bacterium]|nr:HAD-IA family hydrolase [Eubacteriales bacterium]